MDIAVAKSFFMWCSIINAALLLLSFVVWIVAGDFIYRMHSKWFTLSKQAFSVIFYSFLGAMKIFFLFFNLVPWIALLIAG